LPNAANDKRQHATLTLKNGLRVLIISDANCHKSACALTLQTGHFNDPWDCQGLSHLLEHVLFRGNHKDPTVNGLADQLASRGGTINASTGTEFTSYFFDCIPEFLGEALSQFMAMLTLPLLNEVDIQAEISAIDAEFKVKQKDDLRRLYQVHKETCHPEHPFSKFSVGNIETFAAFSHAQLQQKLLELHQRYYQPRHACLCLLSPLPINETTTLIEHNFSTWMNTDEAHAPVFPPLYLPHQLGVEIKIEPIHSAQRLIITFALPSQVGLYRSKPLTVLSHIIGDEGTGSLLNYLKQRDWAIGLSAGGGVEGSNFKDFNINLQLTPKGAANIEEIVTATFAFIKLLKTEGIATWRIDEVAKLSHLNGQFGEAVKSIDEVFSLSHGMFEYAPEHWLLGENLLDHPSQHLCMAMLEYFTPTNMRLKIIQADQATDSVAKWYHTPYKISPIGQDRLAKYKASQVAENMVLPAANPYLHDLTQLKPLQHAYALPTQLIDEAGLAIWYGQDHTFLQPKGDCYLTFDCAASANGIEMATYKRLWVALLNEKLQQHYYQANLAGMHFHFYPHQGGFSLQTSGFSNNQLEFCTQLLSQIVLHEDFSQSFQQVKASQYQGLCNSLLNKPINRLFSRLSVLLQQHNFAPIDMANIMQNADLDAVLEAKTRLLQSFHLEGMMYGNWHLNDTSEVFTKLRHFRGQHQINDPIFKGLVDLRSRPSQLHVVECQHPDEAAVIYVQAPSASTRDVALTILFEQLIAAPFFNQLRTEKQLGYLVGSGYLPYNRHPGIALYIQSPNQQAHDLVTAIKQFLMQLANEIDKYQVVWPSLCNAVIRQFNEPDTHLNMRSQRFWVAIGHKDYHFQHHQKMTECLRQLTFADLAAFAKALALSQHFGEIILLCTTQKQYNNEQNYAIIESVEMFKKSSEYMN
jgi:insulysin